MKKAMRPSHILFISMGGIGNMVMLTPVLRHLAEAFPGVRFSFLLSKNGSREVIAGHPSLDTIIEVSSGVKKSVSIIRQIRKLKPDTLFVSTGHNPLKAGVIGLVSGIAVRLGERFGAGRFLYTNTIAFNPFENEVSANMAIARMLAPYDAILSTTVWCVEPEGQNGNELFATHIGNVSWIGFHMGSGEFMRYKRWPEDRFIALGRCVAQTLGMKIVIFGGANEIDTAEIAAQSIGGGAVSLAGRLTLGQTFAFLQRCPIFVSNDSGPMHLAAAAGCRVIALFGPTDGRRTGPWGIGHQLLSAGLECSPCYNGKKPDCAKYTCMEGIETEQVFMEIEKLATIKTPK